MTAAPKGQPTIQTLAMPANTNANGDIFGGWLMSQMDLAAGVVAKRRSLGRVATIAIEEMAFHHPVHVGDLVCCYADMEQVGNTSMTIRVQAWCIHPVTGTQKLVPTATPARSLAL